MHLLFYILIDIDESNLIVTEMAFARTVMTT